MKNIVILATGGTIAGAGEPGKNVGYQSGVLPAETLLDSVAHLRDVANVRMEQFCNINSDDVTSELWIRLAARIEALDADPQVDGIVVTHGTDTMEETAFFLSLVLKVHKPVVLTGSMRPATAAEPDGPANLLLAVKTAVASSVRTSPTSCHAIASSPVIPAVSVAFADKVMDAASVQKIHTSALDAFAEGVGRFLAQDCASREGTSPKFDVHALDHLPKVSVLYFNAEADEELLTWGALRSAGLVIAGAGAGEFSKPWIEKVKEILSSSGTKPVVVASRVNCGSVVPEQLLVPGTIAAYSLPPAKAAVLLRLALTQTELPAEIQKIFEEVAK